MMSVFAAHAIFNYELVDSGLGYDGGEGNTSKYDGKIGLKKCSVEQATRR